MQYIRFKPQPLLISANIYIIKDKLKCFTLLTLSYLHCKYQMEIRISSFIKRLKAFFSSYLWESFISYKHKYTRFLMKTNASTAHTHTHICIHAYADRRHTWHVVMNSATSSCQSSANPPLAAVWWSDWDGEEKSQISGNKSYKYVIVIMVQLWVM